MKILHVAVVLLAIGCVPYFLPKPPFPTKIEELSPHLQKWYKRGRMEIVNGNKMFYIHQKCLDPAITNPPTFAIIHGFPSSSFEYHKVIDTLLLYGDVVVHDHIGFGFSDKPTSSFTYSLSEAAENTLMLWRKLKITAAHVVSHDMGDSILTEILARRHRGVLPDSFDNFFKSVTFTNGGMKYSMINFRIGQILGGSVNVGSYFVKLATGLRVQRSLCQRQIQSIWGPNSNPAERESSIADICELLSYKGGSFISDKLMYYLWDRAHFEFRWFAALREIDLPIRFVWTDSDAVSPITIPQFFKSFVPEMKLTLVKGAGHFFMLEVPDMWIDNVIKPLASV